MLKLSTVGVGVKRKNIERAGGNFILQAGSVRGKQYSVSEKVNYVR